MPQCARILKPQYKDVYRRTIETPQRAGTFKVNCCLKVHNAHLKLQATITNFGIRHVISLHDDPTHTKLSPSSNVFYFSVHRKK